MEGSIHAAQEYLNFRYVFTFSTIVAIIPFFYMIPTATVMIKICKKYRAAKRPSMDKHIFVLIALNFFCSIMFFLSDYTRLTLPSTGFFTSWCASIQPSHYFKLIFFSTFFFNYCVLMIPFFLCFFRLIILLRPRDNSFICPKIMYCAVPLLIIIPFGCTAFMIPALGYCRTMGPPLRYGAVYLYYNGGWSGWRNSYIHLVMSVVMCVLTSVCTIVMLWRLKKVSARGIATSSVKTKRASTRAESSLTIAMISSMIPFINNTVLTIVYLNVPAYVYYLMIFRPFGNDIETVMMPWILFLTHPMFNGQEKSLSQASTVSAVLSKSVIVL